MQLVGQIDKLVSMEPWVIWIIVAVIFAIGEIMTMGFFLAPLAGGALIAALLAALDSSGEVVWGAFIVASILMFLLIRPIARSHRRLPLETRTGSDALIGRTGIVLERISNDQSSGCVKIDGEVWTARTDNPDLTVDVGTRVRIAAIRGATVVIKDPNE